MRGVDAGGRGGDGIRTIESLVRRGSPLVQPAKQLGEGAPLGLLRTTQKGSLGLAQRLPLHLGSRFNLGCDNSDKTVEQVRQDAVDRLAIGTTQPVGDTRQGQLLDEGGHAGVEGRSLKLELSDHRGDFGELPFALHIRQAPGLG